MSKHWYKIKNFLECDWLDYIKHFYFSINSVYRHSFWILFIITNIVFGFHTINFLWGNHDWNVMIGGQSLTGSIWEGRYGTWIASGILTNNLYLPIISALWSFVALSLSAILLAIYWKVPKKISYFVIFGLVLNITPYTLSWLWYAHWSVNIFFARVFIFTGFILSDKLLQCATKQKLYNIILSILLLNLGLSIYPSYIGTFAMVMVGRILIDMLQWETLKTALQTSINNYKYIIFNIAISVVVYKIILKYMEYGGYIKNNVYNMRTTPLSDIFTKILICIKSAWQQFTSFSISFYPDVLTKLFFLLAIMFIIGILVNKRKTITIKFSIITMFLVCLFASKTVMLIAASDNAMTSRVEFCGYVLFNALIIALCLNTEGILRNIKVLISCIIIYIFAINDLYQQRTWKMGFDAEQMILNRVVERIEMQQYTEMYNKYDYVQLGDWISARKIFYRKKANEIEDNDLYAYSLTPSWNPNVVIRFYNPHIQIKKKYTVSTFANSEFMSVLKRLYDAGILEKAKAWPSKDSVIVYKDIILVVMDDKDLQKAKQIFAEDNKKQALKDKIKAKAKPIATTEPQVEAK